MPPSDLRELLFALVGARPGDAIAGAVLRDAAPRGEARLTFEARGATVHVDVTLAGEGRPHAARTARLLFSYRGAEGGAPPPGEVGIALCRAVAAAAAPREAQVIEAIAAATAPRARPRSREREVPASIVEKRPATEVICTTPWTTLEIVDPDGLARQCCSTWTIGDRGNVIGSSLAAVWNGPGYQEARRIMASGALGALCNPICSRLHDRRFAEGRLRILAGSDAFVQNQLLLAEDLAERREITRARPIRAAICPSTYCNYDCIMCDHGRTPRRELPAEVWRELPELMPTLERLTLLGGEPLASQEVQRFLCDFDAARWPDAVVDLVTNGSLLTEALLRRMTRCSLGGVVVSLNAGTPEIYERVQRGIALDRVLANVDALLRHRDASPRWFGVSLSFVVQPAASHTLLDFARLASSRGLRIRLMALNPEGYEGLDFYGDPDLVAKVIADVDALAGYARAREPEWLPEIMGVRGAILAEAGARAAPRSGSAARRLRVIG
jgi:pyruvate-formate lyase-activating enzyme